MNLPIIQSKRWRNFWKNSLSIQEINQNQLKQPGKLTHKQSKQSRNSAQNNLTIREINQKTIEATKEIAP